MNINYFREDNKSGHKTRESWFIKNHENVYGEIIKYWLNLNIGEGSFKEKIWVYFNNLNDRPKCCCGSYIKFSERFDIGYGNFCSVKCFNTNKDEMLLRIKSTNNKKYGVDFYTEHVDFIDKSKKTKKEKYGDENFNNITKSKKTNLDKYGYDNPSKSIDVIKKIAETNIKKFGHKSPIQNTDILLKRVNTNLIKMRTRFKTDEFIDYDFKNGEYTLYCDGCDSNYVIQHALVNERKRNSQITCLNCNPINSKSSTMEDTINIELLKFYTSEIVRNTNKIIKKELDYFLPKDKLAIEFDGLYWDSELFKPKNYHLDKTIECENNGVELLHIFEDEWVYKKDIVISIIKNKLNLIDIKIYGRKCKIINLDNKTTNEFLNQNHIQGSGSKNSQRYGLVYNDDLVSVMTFSKGRIAIGGKSNEWELTRFCNKKNTIVVGAANKLFKHFLKTINPIKVISYADRRWFKGGVYDKLNFTKTRVTPPNYHYVINNLRYHRFNFRKDVLVSKGYDKNKTEKEIMFERGIYRVYDCGTIRYDWDKPNNI